MMNHVSQKTIENLNIINIRLASIQDRDDIHTIHMSAFPEGENEIVSKLSSDLLTDNTTSQIISLVAEINTTVVGHAAFSPVIINNNDSIQGYILAPLGVKPDYQHRYIGSTLIEHGIQKLSGMGVNIAFVYGDPGYYGQYGFSADPANQFIPPYPLQFPFGWQALVLNTFDLEKPVDITCVPSLCDPKLW